MRNRTRDDVSRISSKLLDEMNCRVRRDYADYRKGKNVAWPKRLLLKGRAKARLKDYANLYSQLSNMVNKVVDIEKQLQNPELSREVRETKAEKQSDYMERIEDMGSDMSKSLTKYMKTAGSYSNVRIDYFIESHKSLRHLKKAKKAKLKKNPFIRFYTFIRGKYRKIEKMARADDRDYIENAVSNLVGRNANGELLYNPEMIDKLKPTRTGAISTVIKQPEIPTPIKALSDLNQSAPAAVDPFSVPVASSVAQAPTTASISLDGFTDIQSIISANQRLSAENEQLRGFSQAAPSARRH